METLQDIWTDLDRRVLGFVRKRVNDPHAAEDLTQDVMLKVQAQLDALPASAAREACQAPRPDWFFAKRPNGS